jgi:hypothetical protein
MKITKQQLTKIIKEELDATVSEGRMSAKEVNELMMELKAIRTSMALLEETLKEGDVAAGLELANEAYNKLNDLIEQPGTGYHYV